MLSEEKQIKLMDYLYGEMSPKEKKGFEAELSTDPELLSELENMNICQDILIQDKVDIPMMPPLILQEKRKQSSIRNLSNGFLKIAASILVIILFAYFFKLRISFKNEGLTIGFGTPIPKKEVKNDKIEEKMMAYLENQRLKENDKWVTLEKKLDAIEKQKEQKTIKVNTHEKSYTIDEVRNMIAMARKKDLKKFSEMLENSNINQEKRMKNLMERYDNYLSEQRRDDLKAIAQDLTRIEEEQNTQKIETENILAELVQTINNNTHENN